MKGTRRVQRGLLFVLAALWMLTSDRQAGGSLGRQSLGRQGVEMQGVGMQGIAMQSLGRQSLGRQSLGRQSLGRQSLGRQAIGLQGLGLQATGLQSLGRQSLGRQSLGRQSLGRQSLGRQSLGRQSLGRQAVGLQGIGLQSLGRQSLGRQGVTLQSLGRQGLGLQGIGLQSIGLQSLGRQSLGRQGIGMEGTALRGIDRVGVVLADVELGALRLAETQLQNGVLAQGLQSGDLLPLVSNIGTDVPRLQAAPGDSGDGTFICIPDDSEEGCHDTAGTFWVLQLSDFPDPDAEPTSETEEEGDFGILLYIAAVEQDTTQNQSSHPDNDDIYLYTVYYRHPGTSQWESLCAQDPYGRDHAMAIPMDYYDRSEEARKSFTFACTGGGVAAKCPRIWGYKPWKTITERFWDEAVQDYVDREVDLQPFYNACVIAARADYCQADGSFTRTGTTVDLFDKVGGNRSIVPTAGWAYAPESQGLMLHEEYQISVDHTVWDLLSQDRRDALSPEQVELTEFLQASGLQSSRYPDLDPGRDCTASPFIDRCDPKEPYACYRANNMPAEAYGAFIAINSPRHCSHSDANLGEALDPLCNECVTRVCEVDPTCCGEAGSNPYPGSLLWGDRCVRLRDEVCRSSPESMVWSPGSVAEPAGSQPFVLPRGPIGALFGIVEEEGDFYAEGWACDPDHAGASVQVQATLNGELGTAAALHVFDGIADQELVDDWQELVGIECGGGSRHGFRIPLPGAAPGDDIFAYAIDLDLPGAPFTLLRGGKKTTPGTTLPETTGVLYSGWLEATETGNYAFQASAHASDEYRVWVNGWLIAADEGYPETLPDSDPPEELVRPRETVWLERGVTYMVRVEHAANDPDSSFRLDYKPPSATEFGPFEPGTLYPLTEHEGNGLRADYLVGGNTVATHRGEADHVWILQTDESAGLRWSDVRREEPVDLPELGSGEVFSVHYHGQVMPPVSGIYTFSAESDGTVRIYIEGGAVTQAAKKPAPDEATCSHDICLPGAPVNKTCTQGNFCAAAICKSDPFCCLTTWDARCVERVEPVCGVSCAPALSEEIFLSAGVKYDIRVEYDHEGGDGGFLRVQWSLPGLAPSVIPMETLFSADDQQTPTLLGTGLNATWFSDEDFNEEFAHTVETPVEYKRSDGPNLDLLEGLVCQPTDPSPSAPICQAELPPWAPFIGVPMNGAHIDTESFTVAGGGAVSNGQIEILVDGAVADTLVPDATGDFETTLSSLTLGKHELTAKVTVGEQTSEPSDPVTVTVLEPRDPAAPDPPEVVIPRERELLPDIFMPYVVHGETGATLYAQIGEEPMLEIDACEGDEALLLQCGALLLDYGAQKVTFFQEKDGHLSPGVVREVGVRPPPLKLTEPSLVSVTNPVNVAGSGASSEFGPVYLADGNDYFARIPNATIDLNPADGTFAGSVTLDPGRHKLKAFQSLSWSDGSPLDGDMTPVEVEVAPPAVVQITKPEPGNVNPRVLVQGTAAPRVNAEGQYATQRRSTVIVYQGNATQPGVKVGRAPVADNGSWSVEVSLAPGDQWLRATQLVPSLSGAGAVESPFSSPAVQVYVRPPAPVITFPEPGAELSEEGFTVTGTAEPFANVSVYTNSSLAATTTADGEGNFVTPVLLGVGTHTLIAGQSIDNGVEGPLSAAVVISVGNTTPPRFCDPSPDTTCSPSSPAPPREIVVETGSATEPVAVDYLDRIGAIAYDGTPVGVECEPGPGDEFVAGTTVVSCKAEHEDLIGYTTFLVTVKSSAPPTLFVSNLVVEAQGPDGAPVNYDASAFGSIADCSPPELGEIQNCSRWEPANAGLGFTPLAIAADPVQPGTLYAALSDTSTLGSVLYRTSDGGETWAQVGSPGVALLDLLVARDGSGTLYAVHPGGLERSDDGGVSWASCFPEGQVSELRGASLNELSPERIIVWGGGEKVPRFASLSVDGCAGWDAIGLEINLSANEYPIYITEDPRIDPISPVFFMSSFLTTRPSTRLFRKVGNENWELLSVPQFGLAGDSPAKWIRVSPFTTDDSVLTSTTISRDGGDTWTELPFGSALAPGALWAPPLLYAGTTGGLVVSANDGSTWSPASGPPLTDLAVDAASQPGQPPILYGREPFGGVVASDDGGSSWRRLEFGNLSVADGRIHQVAADPVNPEVAYLLKPGDGLFKTFNGGEQWVPVNAGIRAQSQLAQWARQIAIDPFARNTVYVAGSRLWKTSNAGGVWTQLTGVPLPPYIDTPAFGAFSLDPYRAGTMYWAPWGQRDLYTSKTGGVSWTAGGLAACVPSNLALNTSGSGTPATTEYDLLDGETQYATLDRGLTFEGGGTHQVTVDLGRLATVEGVTLHHRPDCGPLGHNIPANVGLEVLDSEGRWRTISNFTRSYDLTGGLDTVTEACATPVPPTTTTTTGGVVTGTVSSTSTSGTATSGSTTTGSGGASATSTSSSTTGSAGASDPSYGSLPDSYSFSPVAASQVRWTFDGDGPSVLTEGKGVRSIATGARHSCALSSSGSVSCWGQGSEGQLGNGAVQNALAPVAVDVLDDATKIVAGEEHTCALRQTGEVACWGNNDNGQLGNANGGTNSASPSTVSGLFDAVDVEAGQFHTCAIRATGGAVCWGRGGDGQLGDGLGVASDTPVVVTTDGGDLTGVTRLAAGLGHTCAVLANGEVTCWGVGLVGSLGTGTSDSVPTAGERVVWGDDHIINDAREITSGEFHSCLLRTSGEVACWGYGVDGQLGDGSSGSFSLWAVPVSGISDANSLSSGQYHTCATLEGSPETLCWGLGVSGQLGDAPLTCGNNAQEAGEVCDDGNNNNNDTCENHCQGSGHFAAFPVPVTNLDDAVQLAGGESHTCAKKRGGEVVCWGLGTFGQLGDGSTLGAGAGVGRPTTPVVGLGDAEFFAADVTAGGNMGCATRRDGAVLCWGSNSAGQLGNRSTDDSTVPVVVPSLDSPRDLSAGTTHACAVDSTGTVQCWGSNTFGQLGDGSNVDSSVPVSAGAIPDGATQVAVGANHTCAIDALGGGWCWGLGNEGQIDGAFGSGSTPMPVPTIIDAVGVTAGRAHSCVVYSTGTVLCWGRNQEGQLGDGTITDTGGPTGPASITDAIAISASPNGHHTCALHSTGDVSCWGQGDRGQLGDGLFVDSADPVSVVGINDAIAITTGSAFSCALHGTGQVSCWGWNETGALGDGTTNDAGTPVSVNGVTDATHIAAGELHSCARLSSGLLRCWGSNIYGEAGNGLSTHQPTPLLVEPVPSQFENDATGIAVGFAHTCAVRQTGQVACWGYNGNGQLGTGATGSVADIGLVPTNFAKVSGGFSHTCAIDGAGAVSCWGGNKFGELGNASNIDSPFPTAILDGSLPQPALDVAAYNEFSCAIDTNQDVHCWGLNGSGQLGDGSDVESNVPVSVIGIANAAKLAVGPTASHACAVLNDGGVSCWGANFAGQIGDGTTDNALQPVDSVVGLDTDAIAVGVGAAHSCALRSTGEVACWGSNAFGQLGNGSTDDSLAAVPVSALNDAVALAVGLEHTCAVRSGGTVVCWGHNRVGQLGNGSFVDALVPTPVPDLTGVVEIAAGAHTCARKSNGETSCWGFGALGGLGNGARGFATTPGPVVGFASELDTTPWIGWLHQINVFGCDLATQGSGPAGDALEFEVLPGSAAGLVFSSDTENSLSNDAGETWAALNVSAGKVVVDKSTDPPTYYVGGAMLGGTQDPGTPDPQALYRTNDPTAAPEDYVLVGTHELMAEFQRFAIDPTEADAMYAIGDGFNFMVSPDRGETWYPDSQAPAGTRITNLWVSPADGAVYASALPEGYPFVGDPWDPKQATQGNLWKRSVAGGLPPGARVVEGTIRPVCEDIAMSDRSVLPGATFPIGETELTCTATDAFGNETTDTFKITVEDNTPPIISVPEDIFASAPEGGTANVTFQVTAVDAVDGVVTPTCTPASGSALEAGHAHSVTCEVDDARGNHAEESFNVIVTELAGPTPMPPTLNVNDLVFEATGTDGVLVESYGVSAASADGTSLTATCTPPEGTTFPPGTTTTVSCQAADTQGTVNEAFTVKVVDTTPPVVEVPEDIDMPTEDRFGALVEFTATATDAVDGTFPATCVPASGSIFPPGTTRVTCRATDSAGLSTSASFDVTVTDHTPPELENLEDIVVHMSDITGAPNVTYNVTANDPEDGTLPVRCVPPSPSWFPVGETVVSCSAEDTAGNETRGSFTVTVVDDEPPTVDVPAPIIVEAAGPGGTSVTFAVTASDEIDGALPVSCLRLKGSGLPVELNSGDDVPVGLWEVSCSATDLSGNTGSSQFAIDVRDTIPPTLDLPEDFETVAGSFIGGIVNFTATATDTVSEVVPVGCTPGSGSVFPLGLTEVQCQARDQARNETTGSFWVTVLPPNRPPTLLLPDEYVAEASSSDGATVDFSDEVSATDPEEGELEASCEPPPGSQFAMGETTVECAVTDSGGLDDKDTFVVRVQDTQGPVFGNVPDVVEAYATSIDGAIVTYSLPTATDAVDGDRPVECLPVSGSQFAVNETEVTCAASDTGGRSSEAAFTVWVTYEAPADATFYSPPMMGDDSVFQVNQVVQVVFRLLGASAGITDLVATFQAFRLEDDNSETLVSEGVFTRTGVNYRYAWRTSGLTVGTYLLRSDLGDGLPREALVRLE